MDELTREQNAEERSTQKLKEYGKRDFLISFYLGECYYYLAEYGKAAHHFEMAGTLSKYSDPDWDELYCALKAGEAFLHMRSHYASESYFSKILEEFRDSLTISERFVDTQPFELVSPVWVESQIDEKKLLQPVLNQLGAISYSGEIYIRALIGQAQSLADRDAGLREAYIHVMKAYCTLQLMELHLENMKIELSMDERIEPFLDVHIPIHKANIFDTWGWITFKNVEMMGNLEIAKKYIQDAISLKPNPYYYYHLIHVCKTIAHEIEDSEKEEINLRIALASCHHIRDMAPHQSLMTKVGDLEDEIKQMLQALQKKVTP